MSEDYATYHAESGKTEERVVTPLPALPAYAIPATPPDTLLLLPIVQSGSVPDAKSPCLQLIRQDNGTLSFCNHRTTDICACCGNAVCRQHSYSAWVAFPDEADTYPEAHAALLCETCMHLGSAVRLALRAFRQRLSAEASV